MALNVEKGTVTIDVLGQKTLSLASNFDPKAIIMWGSTRDATGTSVAGNRNSFGFGWGTYRGSTVSQSARAMFAETSDPASSSGDRMSSNTALFILITSTPGIDCEVDLVSMQTGATSEVVIDVVNLDSVANVVVHYLIIGGSDLEDAEVVNSTTSTTSPQDISGTAGFGQPDLVGVLGSVTTGGASGNPMMSIGWGIKDGTQCVHHWMSDDATSVSLGFYQVTGSIYAGSTVPPVKDAEAQLAASSGWPTDGVELTWSDPAPNSTNHLSLLFLKGTFSKAIGTGTNEEVGTPPVNQDINVGFTVKGVITHTGGIVASAVYQTATPNGPSFTVGASDGTNHGQTAWIDDDGDANQRTRHRLSTNRVLEMIDDSAGVVTLRADATADFSVANTLRFAWQTLNGTTREYQYVAIGDAPPGDLTLNPGAISALGVMVAPIVSVVIPLAASLATATMVAPTVNIVSGLTLTPAAIIATASTPAPVVQLLARPPPVVSTAATGTPVPVIRVVLTAPVALGVSPTPAKAITKAATANIALGVSPTPVVRVVIPLAASLATASTPAPFVIGEGLVLPVTAITATAATGTPLALLSVQTTAPLATATTPVPVVRLVVPLAALIAVASTPDPDVVIGALIIPGDAVAADGNVTLALIVNDDVIAVAAVDDTVIDAIVAAGVGDATVVDTPP